MVPSHRQARTLSRALGWFSLGLGVAELVAARSLARSVGLPGQSGLVRAYGLREVATGLALLSTRRPAPWMWARVGGDALDLATLAAGRERPGRQAAIAAVAGVAVLDLAVATSLQRAAAQPPVDYRGRSGFPQPPEAMRGAARADFEAPRDFRTPAALRPWNTDNDVGSAH